MAQQQRTRPNLASTLLEKILNRSCIASLIIANRQGPSGKILYSVDRRFIRPHVDLQKEPSKLLSPPPPKKKFVARVTKLTTAVSSLPEAT